MSGVFNMVPPALKTLFVVLHDRIRNGGKLNLSSMVNIRVTLLRIDN